MFKLHGYKWSHTYIYITTRVLGENCSNHMGVSVVYPIKYHYLKDEEQKGEEKFQSNQRTS